ncbi:GreA/GreB family elongation factor [Bradyrhizobium sp. AZCC 1588]|uniref:GreA/GreB family elongation factor n=1 Tax=unclassified Bradyrhizobium TaxID=2631580 RepID=UPI003FA6027D
MNADHTTQYHEPSVKLPPVTISETDQERLVAVATSALADRRVSPAASNLLREVHRATIVPDDQLPTNVVAVHSCVDVHDNLTGTNSQIVLVFPGEIHTTPDAVSVLTPLGAALIGLSEGASVDWCTASGDRSSKTVLRCRQTPAHLSRILSRRHLKDGPCARESLPQT